MDTASEERLKALLENIEEREQTARRRALIYTLIPILLAVILIWVTGSRVINSQKRYAQVQDSLRVEEAKLSSVTELRVKLLDEIDSLRISADAYRKGLEELNAAEAARTRDKVADSIKAAQSKPRIYLHILRDEQRNLARQVDLLLEANGFIVPGIEKVRRGPRSSELRFFRRDEKEEAQIIQRICIDSGYNMELKDLSKRYENSTTIRPRHYEIWFGQGF